ncbi:class I SAM-dependent methyltransferase [Stutzerimonas nosocomialis]|uniref:class I SAM-dependent methyltransferase n=1 Tax=Stutzerimonas nosocomialis TaxID=1056496 RepID=UPI0011096BAA|nr:class I SAM-dependent methyltransferase [Stutzerimonas nosocomialis]TLX59524.1 class I SAM-dependent methyltransferase [Stutzerimonas nosocomialis]
MTWSGFYDATQGLPAVGTLQRALTRWARGPGLALDLGCGVGRDTLELLRRGWQVRACDAEAEALSRLRDQVPACDAARLITHCERFETLQLPSANLINSSFALPFCAPDHFDSLWQRISSALEDGGLFAGQLFGERDQWASPQLSIHSREQVQALFDGWAWVDIEEIDRAGVTALGRAKHWHLFHIVAER